MRKAIDCIDIYWHSQIVITAPFFILVLKKKIQKLRPRLPRGSLGDVVAARAAGVSQDGTGRDGGDGCVPTERDLTEDAAPQIVAPRPPWERPFTGDGMLSPLPPASLPLSLCLLAILCSSIAASCYGHVASERASEGGGEPTGRQCNGSMALV